MNLSYGDQRRLEVARALGTDPKLLLLDEPTAGMNPQESADFTAFVGRLRDERELTVLMIEHDMKVVMGVSDRVTVLDRGEKIAEGSPAEIQRRRARDRGLPGLGRRAAGSGNGGDAAPSRSGAGMTAPETPLARRRTASRPPLLELDDIHTFYGRIEAVKGVSLTVNEGEIVTLIGANGAGKSTTLRTIQGINRPKRGSIAFDGREIRNGRAARDREDGHRPVARRGGGCSRGCRCARTSRWARSSATTGRRSRRTSSTSTRCSRGCRSGATRRPARCRAASSRCAPSAGR